MLEDKEKKNLGVLVIDMQKEFEGGIDNKIELINSQLKLLRYAKKNNLSIFILEYIFAKNTLDYLTREIRNYENKIFLKKYNDNGFIIKKYYDGSYCYSGCAEFNYFIGDSHLDLELKNKGVENLIVTGVNRDACVLKTSFDAKDRGYKIYTSNDLMNDPLKEGEVDWFRENINYFEFVDDLIFSLK